MKLWRSTATPRVSPFSPICYRSRSTSSFSSTSTSFFSLAFFPSLPTSSLVLLLSLLLVLRSFLFLWPPLCFLYSLITVSPVVCLRSSSLRLSAPFPHAPRSPRDRDTEGNARRAVKVIDITIFPASEPTPPLWARLEKKADRPRTRMMTRRCEETGSSWRRPPDQRVVHFRNTGGGKEATLTAAAHVDGRSSTNQKCKLQLY